MKINKKILVVILAILMACIILQPNKSNAALQSNGGTPATKKMPDWLLQIRQMQELGGTLGRTDTINTTNLTSNATDLDIHMEKNTEYGAMAILSASAYGNPNKINSGDTTTGNSTGIVININKEWTSAGSLTAVPLYVNANPRYKNQYTIPYESKVGDAIKETEGWHNSGNNLWINSNSNAGVIRANSRSIFSYYGDGRTTSSPPYPAYYNNKWSSRSCIVVGTGI